MGAKKAKEKIVERRLKMMAKRKLAIQSKQDLVDSILKKDAPELSAVSTDLLPTDDRSFIDKMCKVLLATTDGVGIAANQIGVLKRVCVFRSATSSYDCVVMINPVIEEESKEQTIATEGCLSYPNVFCEVRRPYWVRVSYLCDDGHQHTTTFADFGSRIACHEIDHLNGICRVGESLKK